MNENTLVTIVNAGQILSIGLDLATKAFAVLNAAPPTSIADELERLEAARLRPSQDIIDEADRASK